MTFQTQQPHPSLFQQVFNPEGKFTVCYLNAPEGKQTK